MRVRVLLFCVLLVLAFGALSGCSRGSLEDFERMNRSGLGQLLERAFPEDTWFALSFSTLEEGQREAFRGLLARFTDDPEAFQQNLLHGVDANLKSVNLSYFDDIQPILGGGESGMGMRVLLGFSEGNTGDAVTHFGVTLEDVDGARALFAELVRGGRFVSKTISGQTLYFNATVAAGEDAVYYFALYEDVILAATDEKEVLEMVNLARSEAALSLWEKVSYRFVLEQLPMASLVYIYMDTASLNAQRAAANSGGADEAALFVQGVTQYLAAQGFAFAATDDGLDFRGFALGDRAAIDADGATLDQLRAKKVYLDQFMPAEHLALYLESYNLGAALDRQFGENGALQSFVGLTAGTNATEGASSASVGLSDLFGRGYALALHQNKGFLPGLTVMVDVKDGVIATKALLQTLDDYVDSLLQVFQIQGGAVAQALSKEAQQVAGGDFTILRLNVNAVLSVYGDTGPFVLPKEASEEDVYLVYGITRDDQLVLSTYEGWLDPTVVKRSLRDDETYELSSDRLKRFKQGVVYVDFDSLLTLADTFEQFRQALSADAALIHEQDAALLGIESDLAELQSVLGEQSVKADGSSPVFPEESQAEGTSPTLVDWTELLAPLKSFTFSSKASKYEVELSGALLLD